MHLGLHFPFRFDRQLLQADLTTAKTFVWQPHYNEQDYGGTWTGIALRSATGETNQLAAHIIGNQTFTDTPLLGRCLYFRQTLSTFQCPLKSVRLLSLAPQSFIREHSDTALGYEDGEIRIHIPIQTNPNVEFYITGERMVMEEGHSYYLNVSLPHRVNNRGQTERIHLVIDAEVNDWVRALFLQAEVENWSVPRSLMPPGNVDEFRRHVLQNPDLQPPLQAMETSADLAAATMNLGRALGFDFHEGDVDAALRCGPLAWLEDAPCLPAPEFTRGWTPVRAAVREGRPFADWLYTGTRRFTEPFFESSLQISLRRPFTRFFRRQMPLEIADQTEFKSTTLAPSGFIFHMSRCGSTLIAQMLAVLPSHLVISESPPLDDILQAHGETGPIPQAEHVQWVQWMIHALGRRRTGEETNYFLKMDAWHIHNLPLLRAAFPKTPWIFVYRDPIEVMVSQLARPGRLSIPGLMDPAILRLANDSASRFSREEWCARVLAEILRSALASRNDPNAICISYRELPQAVFTRVAGHFGMSLREEEVDRMGEVTAFDAKSPSLRFEADSEIKQSAATARVRELSDALLTDLYLELKRWELASAAH